MVLFEFVVFFEKGSQEWAQVLVSLSTDEVKRKKDRTEGFVIGGFGRRRCDAIGVGWGVPGSGEDPRQITVRYWDIKTDGDIEQSEQKRGMNGEGQSRKGYLRC